jgi:hypothetical protein
MSPLEAHLAALGAAGETITYGTLARELGWRMGALTAALEALMEVDHAHGHALRAVVCAGRLNHGMPAEGFFIKALALDIDVSDRAAFVQGQRAALLAAAEQATSAP